MFLAQIAKVQAMSTLVYSFSQQPQPGPQECHGDSVQTSYPTSTVDLFINFARFGFEKRLESCKFLFEIGKNKKEKKRNKD